jgi:hypothetical protein
MKNEKILIRHGSEFRRLIKCVEQSGQQQLDSNPRAVRPPFGTLIKVLMINFRPDHKKHLVSVLLKLSRLACLTPNIHTLCLYSESADYNTSHTQPSQRIYDWEVELSCKWPKLRNLMLADLRADFIQHINTEILLQRLHTLDIREYPGFIFILPPIMSHLQSLKISIITGESLQRLLRILENCGRSLHTLVIHTFDFGDHLDLTNFNLDEIMEQLPNLKGFGFFYRSALPLRINTLTSQLEELHVYAENNDLPSRPDDVRAIKVLFERELENFDSEEFGLSTLKKLRLEFDVFDCYMLKMLIANKDTLEELHFGGKLIFLEIAILMLQEKHVQMEKVIYLSIFDPYFTHTSLSVTKAVFPHVEVITMRRCYNESAATNMLKVLGIWFSTLPNLKQVRVIDGDRIKIYKMSVIETKMMRRLF